MKITVEIDDNLTEEEITIHCRELNDEVISLQKRISEAIQSKMMLNVTKGELEYYLNLPEILFLRRQIPSLRCIRRDRSSRRG